MVQELQLGEIATVQFGTHAHPADAGGVFYLQAKHFNSFTEFDGKIDTWLPADSVAENHLLRDGDILLAGKGFRNFAWLYKSSIGPAVASSIFFVIKARREKVLPEFLVILFNLPQTQQYFQTLGAGSSIPSIRKSELEALPVKLPPTEVQQELVDLRAMHEQDMRLTRLLTTQKQNLFESVAHKIIRGEIRAKI